MTQFFTRWSLRRPSDYRIAVAVYPERVHIAIAKHDSRFALVVNDDIAVVSQNYAAAVQALLERYQRLALKGALVQVVLSSGLVRQTTLERPQLNAEDLAQGLPWAVKDLIDIPPVDMLADYYEPVIEQPGRSKLHVVAVSKRWLQNLLEPLHAAKLDVQGVINEDVGILALLPQQHNPQILLTRTTPPDTELLLIKNKALVVSRQLKSVRLPGQAEGETDADTLAVELQRSMDYFSGQLRQAPLQEVWLALPNQVPNQGLSANGNELCEQLSQSLSVHVERLPYPRWAEELAAGDYSDIGALAGLALLYPGLPEQSAPEAQAGVL